MRDKKQANTQSPSSGYAEQNLPQFLIMIACRIRVSRQEVKVRSQGRDCSKQTTSWRRASRV